MAEKPALGYPNATLDAIGGEAGVERLVDRFYLIMDSAEYAHHIRSMHPTDLSLAREKLTTFLVGWMGGARHYTEKFGGISLPGAHAHFVINETDRDAWLNCMKDALIEQGHNKEVIEYLLRQLAMPAQRIVEASAAYAASRASFKK